MAKRKKGLKRKSKTPLAKTKEKLWKTLRQVVIKRDGDVCIACGKKPIGGAGQHGGHLIPSSTCGTFLRYDLRNIFSECYFCNINLGGNGAVFLRSIEFLYGKKFVERLFKDKQREVKWGVKELEQLNDYYTTLLDKTDKQLLKLTKNYEGFTPKGS